MRKLPIATVVAFDNGKCRSVGRITPSVHGGYHIDSNTYYLGWAETTAQAIRYAISRYRMPVIINASQVQKLIQPPVPVNQPEKRGFNQYIYFEVDGEQIDGCFLYRNVNDVVRKSTHFHNESVAGFNAKWLMRKNGFNLVETSNAQSEFSRQARAS